MSNYVGIGGTAACCVSYSRGGGGQQRQLAAGEEGSWRGRRRGARHPTDQWVGRSEVLVFGLGFEEGGVGWCVAQR
jgi:hypothetical protein